LSDLYNFPKYYEIADFENSVSWDMEENDIRVKTTVQWQAVNRVEQTFRETHSFEVDNTGKITTVTGSIAKRATYTQEFLFFYRPAQAIRIYRLVEPLGFGPAACRPG